MARSKLLEWIGLSVYETEDSPLEPVTGTSQQWVPQSITGCRW
jgi:hypothetical protein